jgi:hypothetical protein
MLALGHSMLVKRDCTNFEIDSSFGVEVTELYPGVKYTSVDTYLNAFVWSVGNAVSTKENATIITCVSIIIKRIISYFTLNYLHCHVLWLLFDVMSESSNNNHVYKNI